MSSYLTILLKSSSFSLFFFFNDTAPTEIYTLSLHDALPLALEERLAGAAAFGVQGSENGGEFCIGIGRAGGGEDVAGFRHASAAGEPTRAFRNREERGEEAGRGEGGDAELPTPFGRAEALEADQIVGEVGDQDAADDIELEHADQTPAVRGRGDFGDVHGPDDGRGADGEAAENAGREHQVPVAGEGAAERGKHVHHGEGLEAGAAAVAVGGPAGEERAGDGAPERGRDGDAEQRRGELELLREGAGGAGDHRGIETEKEPAERGDEGAGEEIAVHCGHETIVTAFRRQASAAAQAGSPPGGPKKTTHTERSGE